MDSILEFISHNPWFTFIGAITIIQITPIKINPWSWIGKQIRRLVLGDLEKSVEDMKKSFIEEKIENKRWHILDFANSCRQGRRHTKEEWEHCLSELTWYETYCDKHSIKNGVIEECSKYIRDCFQERLHKNDFLI